MGISAAGMSQQLSQDGYPIMKVEPDHFQQGYHFQEAGNWIDAIEEFLQVLRENSDYELARVGLAYCYLKLNDFEKAVGVCKELINERSPQELRSKLWLQYSDENPHVLGAYALFKVGNLAAAGGMLESFSKNENELLIKFFERSHNSKIWLEICGSGIKTPLIEARKKEMGRSDN